MRNFSRSTRASEPVRNQHNLLPGNGHGGSLAAVCDDIVGTTGGVCLLQLHLEGAFQKEPAFKSLPPDTQKYISLALDTYYKLPPEEQAEIRLHPDLTLAKLEAARDKLLPYSIPEITFILPLATRFRGTPAPKGSTTSPTGLVAEISCRLKRRVPLLTRLAIRGRVTGLENGGKRIRVVAEIWGKKNTRISALEPDESGGWEGEWDVLLAEGKGTLAVIYGSNLFQMMSKKPGEAKI